MESETEKKSFFNVIGLSDAFRKFDDNCNVSFKKLPTEAITVSERELRFFELQMKQWEIRAQLATAQQLTVISESLKRILKLVVREP